MTWSHPDISLEDLLKLFKGFVDILILSSGYQSSGTLAHWDPQNIKRAFQWGIFFENILKSLRSSENYQDSLDELDSALLKITSTPLFPQGLAHLSAATLHQARLIVLGHLIHALPLREKHLRAIAEASIDLDLDELNITEVDSLGVYLDKLVLHEPTVCKDQKGRDPISSSQDIRNGSFTKLSICEVMKRQLKVSCVSSIEAGLEVLHTNMRQLSKDKSEFGSYEELQKCRTSTLSVEHLIEYQTWNRWRENALSYFLDKETVRLVSGSSMVFSAPSMQWVPVIERLSASSGIDENQSGHIFEILLLGCIGRRWSFMIDHFMSISYDSLTTLEQYHEVCSLLLGRSKIILEDMMKADEKGILEHLTTFSGNKLQCLWSLSPVLVASAIPSWSPLFRLYLSDVGSQLKGDGSTISRCSCAEKKMDHNECCIKKLQLLRMNAARVNLCFFLAITCLLTVLSSGDWNILNQKRKRPISSSISTNDLKSYCESWRINVELNNIRDTMSSLESASTTLYMKSTQYQVDSLRAIEEASLFLSDRCIFNNDGRDAWIFDIDDTLLSMLPYFKKHQFGGEKLNRTAYEGWMRETKAPALEHTKNLFNEIRGVGIKVFLVSSRRECLRDATVNNLIKVGYHGWSGLILRGLEDENKQVHNYKAEVRKRLVDEGYHIWGIDGDQWSSFD